MWICVVGLLFAEHVKAQFITVDVHNVPLADVLYDLARVAEVDLIIVGDMETPVSMVLTQVDAAAGLRFVCEAFVLSCRHTPEGFVAGALVQATEVEQGYRLLRSVKLNYGNAKDVVAALNNAPNILSTEGHWLADGRSQQILIYDFESNIQTAIAAVTLLDQPLGQLLIESRIVIAKSDIGQSSGLDFIGSIGGKGSQGVATDSALALGFSQLGGALQLGIVGAHVMLNLELAALEVTGKVLTLAQPQILVQEGYTGSIETGQEVPYLLVGENGQQQEWKQAVLGLTVTPRMMPHNQVQLDLEVMQDSIGDLLPNGQLALNTHRLKTRATVGVGQTLVLGGALYEQQLDRLLSNPLLAGLPIVGEWFKHHKQGSERFELLIFVTPRIVTP